MRNFPNARRLAVCLLLPALLLLGGCGETEKPPTAIALDQIPAEMGKAFASAKPEPKSLSDDAVAAVQNKEFPKAAAALQTLTARPDLSKVQARVVAGATLTINTALLEAESKGDAKASQFLDARRLSK